MGSLVEEDREGRQLLEQTGAILVLGSGEARVGVHCRVGLPGSCERGEGGSGV